MANVFEKIGDNTKDVFEANTRDLGTEQGRLGPRNTDPYAADPIVNFSNSNTSYSGTDCTVLVQLNEKLIVLGNLETFSYSIFREKSPVRVLGRSHAKGYTSGSRSIAGSMVFVVFDRAPLYEVIREVNYVRNPTDRNSSPLPDQLPALDLIIVFNNEYGHQSLLRLYGVEFQQEGQVHSINDLYSENTMQYIAQDIDELVAYEELRDFKDMLFERQVRGLFVDNHLTAMLEYSKRIKQQLEDTNNVISGLDIELGRRAVSGVVTLGASVGLAALGSVLRGKNPVTRQDLLTQKDKQLKVQKFLITELEKTNTQVDNYNQNIKGYNGYQSGQGNVGVAAHTNDRKKVI